MTMKRYNGTDSSFEQAKYQSQNPVFRYNSSNSRWLDAYLTSGLVGYWSFENTHTDGQTIQDASGKKNDGSLVGGVTTNSSGNVGSSFEFDGIDGEVSLPKLGLGGEQSVTVSAWVYVSGSQTKNNVFGFGGKSGNDTFSIRTDGDGTWNFYFWANDLIASTPQYYGSWTHIVGLYDSSIPERRVYQNNVEIKSDDPGSVSFVDDRYSVGGFNTEYFEGKIDEVRVYDRALSDTEIDALYQQGKDI